MIDKTKAQPCQMKNFTQAEIISKTNETVIGLLKERSKKDRFSDSDSEGYGCRGLTGEMASMQGLRSVLGAFVALGDESGFEKATKAIRSNWSSLSEEWNGVVERLEKDFVNISPYVEESILKDVIGPENSAYTDTVSWAISTAIIYLRVLDQYELEEINNLRSSTLNIIGKAVLVLYEIQGPDGGWSFTAPKENHNGSDLIFTYSAQQALADIDDYVFDRIDDDGSFSDSTTPLEKEINREIRENDQTIKNIYEVLTRKSVKFLVEKFVLLATAGTEKSNEERDRPAGIMPLDIAVEGQIEPKNEKHDLVAAYYEGYLLEALIISRAEEYYPDTIKESMRHLYYRLIGRFGELSAKVNHKYESIKSAKHTTLAIEVMGSLRARSGDRPTIVYSDAGLWAQILRALILFRYYVEPLNQPEEIIVSKEGSALAFLLADRREDEGQKAHGLWDDICFNLAYTARAIEALVDSYDYFNKLEMLNKASGNGINLDSQTLPTTSIQPGKAPIEKSLLDLLKPSLQSMIDEKFSAVEEKIDNLQGLPNTSGLKRRDYEDVAGHLKKAIIKIGNKYFDTIPDNYNELVDNLTILNEIKNNLPADLNRTNPETVEFVCSMLDIVFALIKSKFPELIEEAIICKVTKEIDGKSFSEMWKERVGLSNGWTPIAERIEDVLIELAGIEYEYLDGSNPENYPSYKKAIIKALNNKNNK